MMDGEIYYSTGLTASQTTINEPPVLVSAATSTDGTIITLTFDKAMADPIGKHGQFEVSRRGRRASISREKLSQ